MYNNFDFPLHNPFNITTVSGQTNYERLYVGQRVYINGLAPNGLFYKNEPAKILLIVDVYLVQFDNKSKGILHPLYGNGTAEVYDYNISTSPSGPLTPGGFGGPSGPTTGPNVNRYDTGCFIKLLPFPSVYKELIMRRAVTIGNNPRLLPGLGLNFSNEFGFELPLTDAWRNKLINNINIIYHNSRQLNFIEYNNMVIGLKCLDDVSYWDANELRKIKMIVDKESVQYRKNIKTVYTPPSYNPINTYLPGSLQPIAYNQPPSTLASNDYSRSYYEPHDEDITNFFLDKILIAIEKNQDFSKLKKFTKKLNTTSGYKIIHTILKLYIKKNRIDWDNLKNDVYQVKEFIKSKLLKK